MAIEETQFKPATLVSTDESSDAEYIYADVKAPIMSGFAIKAFAWTLENRVGGPLLLNYLKKANLVTRVFIDSHYHEVPMHIPRFSIKVHEQPAVHQVDHELSSCDRLASAVNCLASSSNSDSQEHFHRWTIQDYSKAYSAKRITPLMVAERCLQAIQDSCKSKPDMGFFISCYEADVLRQAEESTDRFKKGKPLSILDGIPIAIKDEIDCLPYPTTGGTKWLSKVRAVKDDADCVKQLRNCGAILLGKTNMHELGLGTTGINPHYGASRNPYDRRKFSGGSSGGSAATVAAGLCPVSLGVDGGGSVRIPSALCGVVGLKGTFGRVSPSGVLPLNWTLGMTGIHAATVEDALLVYAVIHGHPSAEHTVSQPPALHLPILKELEGLQGDSMIGAIRFAKYTKWFEHCDASIAEGCYKVLGLLEQHYGCKVIEVTVPEIEEMRLAHYVTIACECNTSLGLDYTKLGKMQSGFDTRAAFAIYKGFNNREFLAAQRMRSRQMHYHSEIFKKADFIVTPATACTAQLINPSALETGELNYIDGAKLMRYQIAANVLGLPAITVPVGYDSTGMPMGIHLLGPPWSEAAMLRVAFVIELAVDTICDNCGDGAQCSLKAWVGRCTPVGIFSPSTASILRLQATAITQSKIRIRHFPRLIRFSSSDRYANLGSRLLVRGLMAESKHMKPLIHIDVTSDTVCPWCFVGKRYLENAMNLSKDRYNFEVQWHPFFLNPNADKEGIDKVEYYKKKFGVERTSLIRDRLTQVFHELGLSFKLGGLTGSTWDSHRLIELAGRQGLDKQNALVEELFLNYFTQEKYIGDRKVLLEAASKAGISGAEEMLNDPTAGAKEIQLDLQRYAQGVTGVPHFLINGKRQLSGAQPPESFLKVFEQAATST